MEMSGYGGIGRRARFRFWWETVQVQVLLPAQLTAAVFMKDAAVSYITISRAAVEKRPEHCYKKG